MWPFKNVVAQFIGRLCLINQATTLNLPHVKAKPVKQKRIEQIDIIWAQAVYETPGSLNPWETAYH